jgi:hypothetical protein
MKLKIIFAASAVLALLLTSCSKEESPLEPLMGPAININLSATAGKTFTYQYFDLDSLNNRVGTPQIIVDKISAVNISYGGYNDVIKIINIAGNDTGTTYLRIIFGKDIYQWMDTAAGFGKLQLGHIKDILQKQSLAGIWVPLALLSRGEGVEYVKLPKRTTTIYIDPMTSLPMTIEIKAKNEGFENVTVPAGTFKAYKIKTTVKVEILSGTTPIETITLNIFAWISDDIDYIVKQERKSVTSATFKMTLNGFVQELQSTGM